VYSDNLKNIISKLNSNTCLTQVTTHRFVYRRQGEWKCLPKIHKSMSCYLSETCTAIDCCIDVEQIGRSVNVYINLDACNYRLTAGIEKVTFDIPLLQYQFGQKQKH
jgi:hypothetical protein